MINRIGEVMIYNNFTNLCELYLQDEPNHFSQIPNCVFPDPKLFPFSQITDLLTLSP